MSGRPDPRRLQSYRSGHRLPPGEKSLRPSRSGIRSTAPKARSWRTSFGASPPQFQASIPSSVEELAIPTTAITGTPPESHEREAVSAPRPHSLGFGAEGRAQYKVRPQAGTHVLCVGPSAERDARLRTRRGHRRGRLRSNAQQPHSPARGPWSATANSGLKESQGDASRTVRRRLIGASEQGLGSLGACRTCLTRLPTCRPTPGLRSRLPGPQGLLMSRFRIFPQGYPANSYGPIWRGFRCTSAPCDARSLAVLSS